MPEAGRGSHRRFCALLSAERACTVYPARPLGCRGVMAADAIACEENHHGTRAEVTYLGPPMQIRLAIHLPLMAALRAEGLAWKLHDLPIALAIALARADAEAAWRAGEPVFAAAALPDERFDPRKLDAVDALDPARG
jgi:Fe-S-cluster containining protein